MKTKNSFLHQLNVSISVALFSCSLMLLGINHSYANNVPEYTAFGLAPAQDMPNPEARQYITKTVKTNQTPEYFNAEPGKFTQSVVISGHVLVFEPGHENGLWESYHEHKTLQQLELHADTIIIRGALRLPQTDLSIYARVLSFDDTNGTAVIDTSPYVNDRQALELQPGLNGNQGGDMNLHISQIQPVDQGVKRFILNGAQGQKGGKGKVGENGGKSISFYTGKVTYGIFKEYNFISSHQATYINRVKSKTGIVPQKDYGDKSKRQNNGKDAKKPGVSGNGGKGGTFTAPVFVSDFGVMDGGSGGRAANYVSGGSPSEPRTVNHWECDSDQCKTTDSFTARSGQGYSGTAGNKGADGVYKELQSEFSWMTSPLFSQSLRYAKDLYLHGYYAQLEIYLNGMISLVNAYKASSDWNRLDEKLDADSALQQRNIRQAELDQLFNEALMLQQRLNAGLDYFSKPLGWVPGLSFEVNQTVYDNEIDAAMDVLWLTHAMQQNINSHQARKTYAQQMVNTLNAEVDSYKAQYQEANDTIAALRPRIEQLNAETQNLQFKLNQRAEALRSDAEETAFINGIRDSLLAATEHIPLANVATRVAFELPNVDPDKPILNELLTITSDAAWETGKNAMDDQAAISDCIADSGDPEACAIAQGVKDAQEKAALAKQQGQLAVDLIRGNSTNNAAVNAELQRILAEDPRWLELTEQITELQTKKAVLVSDLLTAIDTLNQLSNAITKNLLAVDVFHQDVINATDILDPRVIAYTKDMAHRARHRLELYQYYMVRTYEYRMVRPYPFTLDLNALFDDFCRLQAANEDNDLEVIAKDGCDAESVNLNEDDFKNLGLIFKEQISSIAEEIISEFNNGGGVSQDTAVEFDLPDFYIQQINQNPDGVKLNLVDDLMLFNNSEEDIRIRSIEVIDMQFSHPGILNYVDISFKHDGISQIRKAGESYLFQHYLNSETSPIQWITRYNGNGTLQGLQNNSSSSRSLIASIIGENAANLNIFASPGAWANLTVVRTASPSSSTQGVQMSSMRIRVNYEYTPTENNIKTLHVAAESMTQAPPITVLTPDVKQRSNGQGNFLRSYPIQTSVSLSAPLQYGQLEFEGWQENGQLVSTEPVFNVSMNSDKTVLPKYKSTLAMGGNDLTPLASATIFGGSSASRFYAGAKNNQGNYQTQFVSNEPVDIVARMDIGAEYQGQQANIYLVGQYQGQWFMKNSAQQWQPWDFSIAGLVPNQVQTLSTQLQLTVQEDLSGLPGQFAIFVGHSSTDGNIHYNGQPLSFSVQ